MCNEAALHAARHKQNIVRIANLEYAVERVVGKWESVSAKDVKEKQQQEDILIK